MSLFFSFTYSYYLFFAGHCKTLGIIGRETDQGRKEGRKKEEKGPAN